MGFDALWRRFKRQLSRAERFVWHACSAFGVALLIGLSSLHATAQEQPIILKGDAVHAMSISVRPSRATFSGANEKIAYTYTIKNTGNVPVELFALRDDKVSGINCHGSKYDAPFSFGGPLGVAEIVTCVGSYTTDSSDVRKAKSFVNNAILSVSYSGGTPIREHNARAVVEFVPKAALSLQMWPLTESFSAAGEKISYRYKITNSGSIPVANFKLEDPKTQMRGECATWRFTPILEPGAVLWCEGTYETRRLDVGRPITNQATLSFISPAGPATPVTVKSQVPFLAKPKLSVTVDPSVTEFSAARETIKFKYKITNTGNAVVESFNLKDPRVADISCRPVANGATLEVGRTTYCFGEYTTTQADIAHKSTTWKYVLIGGLPKNWDQNVKINTKQPATTTGTLKCRPPYIPASYPDVEGDCTRVEDLPERPAPFTCPSPYVARGYIGRRNGGSCVYPTDVARSDFCHDQGYDQFGKFDQQRGGTETQKRPNAICSQIRTVTPKQRCVNRSIAQVKRHFGLLPGDAYPSNFSSGDAVVQYRQECSKAVKYCGHLEPKEVANNGKFWELTETQRLAHNKKYNKPWYTGCRLNNDFVKGFARSSTPEKFDEFCRKIGSNKDRDCVAKASLTKADWEAYADWSMRKRCDYACSSLSGARKCNFKHPHTVDELPPPWAIPVVPGTKTKAKRLAMCPWTIAPSPEWKNQRLEAGGYPIAFVPPPVPVMQYDDVCWKPGGKGGCPDGYTDAGLECVRGSTFKAAMVIASQVANVVGAVISAIPGIGDAYKWLTKGKDNAEKVKKVAENASRWVRFKNWVKRTKKAVEESERLKKAKKLWKQAEEIRFFKKFVSAEYKYHQAAVARQREEGYKRENKRQRKEIKEALARQKLWRDLHLTMAVASFTPGPAGTVWSIADSFTHPHCNYKK